MSKLRFIALVFACLAGMNLPADADEIGKIKPMSGARKKR